MSGRARQTLFILIAGFFLLATAFWFARAPFGDWFFQKGVEAKREWRLETAINYFSWANFLKKSDNAIYEKAICHQLRGEFDFSQKELDKITEKGAKILNASGVNRFNQNEADEALNSHEQALKLSENQKQTAEILIDLSRVQYHTKGNHISAAKNLETALKLGRELNDENIEADALRNIGVVRWWFKGELDAPLNENYLPALELYRKTKNLRGEAITLSNIAFIHQFKGDLFKFLQLQNESLAIKEKIGDLAGLSDSYSALGTMYLDGEEFRKAREFLEKCLNIAKQIGYRLNQNDTESYLARIHSELEEYDTAIDLTEKILGREQANTVSAKYRMATLAAYYFHKGAAQKSLEIYQKVLEIERTSNERDARFEYWVLNYLGNVYLALDDFQNAEKYFREARLIDENREATDINRHLRPYIFQAAFWQKKGDFAKVFDLLTEAAEFESKVFSSIGTNLLAASEMRDYDQLFELLLDKQRDEKSARLAFRFLEQRRYRAFRNFIVQASEKNPKAKVSGEKEMLEKIRQISENLKQKNDSALQQQLEKTYGEYENLSLQNQLAEPSVRAVAQIRPAKLEEIQTHLDTQTAVIEYVFTREKVFALVLKRNEFRFLELPVTKANLKNKVKIFRNLLFEKRRNGQVSDEENSTNSDWFAVSESLRSSLIEPLKLDEVKRLAIVPEGFLHDLPFAALAKADGEKVRFLIEDFTVFYLPSATFLQKDFHQKDTNDAKNFFSFGINQTENLPDLRFAEEESAAVAEIFGGKSNVKNLATETAVKSSIPNANYLHFATHAVVEPNMPLLSRLVFAKSETDDGNLTTREIFALGLDAELVTIAACESGFVFSAEENITNRVGLTEAFLHAGAKSVLSSLLPVSDAATVEFMKDFYSNLKAKDKTEALAQSQRKMLHGKFKHPRFWSPFILVGKF